MNRAPAFQFYPRDWLDFRVQRMSLAAQGAYIRLLGYMWADGEKQCSIVDNNELLARAIGATVEEWQSLRKEIQCDSDPILEGKNGRLVSARLRQEAAKQRKYRQLQSKKGQRSGQVRRNHGSCPVQQEHQPKDNSSSSLNHREKEKSPKIRSAANDPAGFGDFWTAYPKKEGRKGCVQWWLEHKPGADLLAVMLAKIAEAKQTKKWRDENGKFIPMPITWLLQERWNDELTIKPMTHSQIEVEL